jgi:hypothetical protein
MCKTQRAVCWAAHLQAAPSPAEPRSTVIMPEANSMEGVEDVPGGLLITGCDSTEATRFKCWSAQQLLMQGQRP